jgi:hypothetical protein
MSKLAVQRGLRRLFPPRGRSPFSLAMGASMLSAAHVAFDVKDPFAPDLVGAKARAGARPGKVPAFSGVSITRSTASFKSKASRTEIALHGASSNLSRLMCDVNTQ